MNKSKGTSVKKTLVRNPKEPVPPTIKSFPFKSSIATNVESSCMTSLKSQKAPQTQPDPKIRFDLPEIHSALKLSKKADELVKPRNTKNLSDVDKASRFAFEEKISRKVNIPYDQQVFKDLIPLENSEAKLQKYVVAKSPIYQKCQEPVLADFLEPRVQRNYYHKPQKFTQYLVDKKSSFADGLRLYNILYINEVGHIN
ncbi:uncharacterized protein [Euwallacea fornicatus]|uniref:uncharacterized protein n=1 Tax=Euwallacea fornicatus TaxID=995702 RepID=UPI0033904283